MWLAFEGYRRGHDIAFVDYLDLSMDPSGEVWGKARVPSPGYSTRGQYAAALRSPEVPRRERCLSDDAIVFLRNNPADRMSSWVEKVGNPAIPFGRLLQRQGVAVINDPAGLAEAGHPGYLLTRIADLMPPTLLSRDPVRIERFLRDLDGPAVLKPLAGYGGFGVFYLQRNQVRNVRAMIETLASGGYVVAQGWIPGAHEGDKRVLMWRGRPLELAPGRWSAYLRRGNAGEHRHNIHAGGRPYPCELGPQEIKVIERVGGHLAKDGLALVGLDLIAETVLEINIFCPGGLHNLHALYGFDVAAHIWGDLEAGLISGGSNGF